MSNFHVSTTSLGTTPGRLGPGAGTADGQDLRAEGVLQAGQGPQAPEDLVLAVDDDVVLVDALDGEAVACAASGSGG